VTSWLFSSKCWVRVRVMVKSWLHSEFQSKTGYSWQLYIVEWRKNSQCTTRSIYRRYESNEIFMKYLKQNAGCISWCTRWARRPYAEKLLSTTLHTPYLAEIWRILCLDPSLLCARFTAAVPSTIITRRCVLRSTLAKPWVPTVWP